MRPLTGDRATPEELAAWSWKLGGWLTPEEFGAVVSDMDDRQGDYALDQPGSIFKEAFLAHRVATLSGADGVRLGADPPDFELIFGRRIEQFESVEVVAPGRRRGDELKADRLRSDEDRRRSENVLFLPYSDALAAITNQVSAKSSKPYAPGTILSVYVNVGWVTSDKKLHSGLAEAVAHAFPAFGQVWVMDSGRLSKFTP